MKPVSERAEVTSPTAPETASNDLMGMIKNTMNVRRDKMTGASTGINSLKVTVFFPGCLYLYNTHTGEIITGFSTNSAKMNSVKYLIFVYISYTSHT